ncbi:MAG TPA: PQQ-dependent sugar dehydrogenase [Thermomicrobiales bacterium]|nr:PQQ-dependent sugar dehydrogenase [Thermomicrobiales bacterium]
MRTRTLVALVVILTLLIPGFGLLAPSSPTPARAQDQGQSLPDNPDFQGVATPGGTIPNNPKIQLVKVAGGLADPINIASANDGSGRIFVVERIGRIRIVDKDGKLLPDPFLDIQSLVKTDFLEQGLLGLAFSPDYKTNGLFYVYYSDYQTNGDVVLSEYKVSSDDPNKADPKSARILFTQDKPYVNHNGGTLRFGPDKMLYISIGDGGLAGDPYDNAQRTDVLLGKLLRIDPNARDAGAYGIPKDNPFANTGVVLPSDQASDMAQDGSYHPAARREICNWGLRNPWQFNFDPKTGELYLDDVGQNAWEEVDVFPANQPCNWNLGWDHNEGASCYPPGSKCLQAGALPVATYNHKSGDCSITGIGVYRGSESTNLDGIYFNSDFCSGKIYGLQMDSSGAWQYQVLLQTGLSVTGSGQDENGELYVTSCSCKYSRDYNALDNPGGAVWRIVSADKVPQGAELAPSPSATAGTPEAAATPQAATPAASPVAGGGQASTQQSVDLVDIAFQPNELTIPAGQDVTITLTNKGKLPHTFTIDQLGVDSGPVQPGDTATVKINAQAGDYQYYCKTPGHKEAGMVGTLHVK